MSNVDVNLLSRPFNIACKLEQQDALNSAATMLDNELHTLQASMTQGVEFEKLVVTAALNFCGRYERLVAEFEEYMTAIIGTNNDLSEQLSSLPNAADFIPATAATNANTPADSGFTVVGDSVPQNSSQDESLSSTEDTDGEFSANYDKPLTGFDAGVEFSPFEDDEELDIEFEPTRPKK